MKKFIAIILCGIILVCFAACGEEANTNINMQPTETTAPSETTGSLEDETTGSSEVETTEPPEDETTATPETEADTKESEVKSMEELLDYHAFATDNVKRITFYAYYGRGKGSDVPAENFDEIIAWLDTFRLDLDKKIPDLPPPGTNTVYVEIEYSDGTVVKKGLDIITVDGIPYYIKGETAPDCYSEILSKTSLD